MKLDLKLHRIIKDKLSKSSVQGLGVTVFTCGEIKYSDNFGKLDGTLNLEISKETIFHGCSISKMITAIGVLRLVQSEILDLDKDVNSYLKEVKIENSEYTKNKKVTLRNILAHQGGFKDSEGSFDIYNSKDKLASINDILKPLKVDYIPESEFSYSDKGYCVIEKIIENVTKESFISAMNHLVIEPLKLKRTFFLDYNRLKNIDSEFEVAVGHHKDGSVVENRRAFYPYLASAGIWTTHYEMSLITQEIIKAYLGESVSFLKPELAKLMLSSLGEKCNPYIGLGVFISKGEPINYFQSNGWGVGFQSMLVAYPNKKNSIVVMINSDPEVSQDESLVGEVVELIKKEFKF